MPRIREELERGKRAASLIRYFEEHGPQSPNAAALNVLRIRGMVMDGIHEDYWKRRGTVRRRKVA